MSRKDKQDPDEGVTFGELPYGATGYDPTTRQYTWDTKIVQGEVVEDE